MAEINPYIHIGIYRGPEDGEDDIKNDPFLNKLDPIEEAIFKTREMAIARGELEIRKAQKIVRNWSIDHALHRFEINNDEGKVFRIIDERSGIVQDIGITTSVTMSLEIGDTTVPLMTSQLESYQNAPYFMGRFVRFYNGT